MAEVEEVESGRGGEVEGGRREGLVIFVEFYEY